MFKFKNFFWKNKTGFNLFLSFFFFFKPFSVISSFKNFFRFSENYLKKNNNIRFSFFYKLAVEKIYYFDFLKIINLKNQNNKFFDKPGLFTINSRYNYVKIFLKKFYFFRFLKFLHNKFKKKFRWLNFKTRLEKN